MNDFPGKSPSEVSDDHLRAIGAVVVNWSALEMLMELAILGFYDVPMDRGLVLTSNVGFQSRLSILRIFTTQGGIKDASEAENCKQILNRIEGAYGKRNTVAHGLWSAGRAQGLAERMAIRVRGSRLACVDEQVPLMDLERTAAEFLEIAADFTALLKRLGITPSPRPSAA